MIVAILLIIVSLVALYFGADWLVRGSSSAAVRFGFSPLVIGLTVVALGTSAPELVVSVKSALNGVGGIALGNVVGSNIFNVCAILGLAAIIYPLQVNRQLIKIDAPIMIIATAVFCIFCYLGFIPRWGGILLLIAMFAYIIICIRKAKSGNDIETKNEIKVSKNIFIDILLVVIGVALLVVGSNVLVDNATIIARTLGWSDAVIGLTIVAAGTSMPELATSVVAAFKKRTDIAIGNVIGSNIINIFVVLGATATISPLKTNEMQIIDLCVMGGAALLILPFMRTGFRINRNEGFILFTLYIAYTIIKIMGV